MVNPALSGVGRGWALIPSHKYRVCQEAQKQCCNTHIRHAGSSLQYESNVPMICQKLEAVTSHARQCGAETSTTR